MGYGIQLYIWVNYHISITWNKANWGWFPFLTMIPVRSQWGRHNLPRLQCIDINHRLPPHYDESKECVWKLSHPLVKHFSLLQQVCWVVFILMFSNEISSCPTKIAIVPPKISLFPSDMPFYTILNLAISNLKGKSWASMPAPQHLMWNELMWCNVKHVVWCDVMCCSVMSCHLISCSVMQCSAM